MLSGLRQVGTADDQAVAGYLALKIEGWESPWQSL